MRNIDIRTARAQARSTLSSAGDQARRMILVHAGVLLGAELLCNLVALVIGNRVEGMTGLSAVGPRSRLLAIQYCLVLLVTLVTPLWKAGYGAAVLDLARQKQPPLQRLLYGFVRWSKLVLCGLLLLLRLVAFGYLAILAASFFAGFTPWAAGLDLVALETSMNAGNLDAAAAMLRPLLALSGAAVAIVVMYLLYRYRPLFFLLADEGKLPAGQLLRAASDLTRGNRFRLLGLDLSFWWYYLLLALVNCIPYADFLLGAAGVTVSLSPLALGAILCTLYTLAALALAVLAQNRVQLAHAEAYRQLYEGQTQLQNSPL